MHTRLGTLLECKHILMACFPSVSWVGVPLYSVRGGRLSLAGLPGEALESRQVSKCHRLRAADVGPDLRRRRGSVGCRFRLCPRLHREGLYFHAIADCQGGSFCFTREAGRVQPGRSALFHVEDSCPLLQAAAAAIGSSVVAESLVSHTYYRYGVSYLKYTSKRCWYLVRLMYRGHRFF